jgi:hypothetical protein
VIEKIDVIVNQIGNGHTHKMALAKAQKIYEAYRGKIPFYNNPESINSMDGISLLELASEVDGIEAARSIICTPFSPASLYSSVQEAGLEYPLIVREWGKHSVLKVINHRDAPLEEIAFDGRHYQLPENHPALSLREPENYRLFVIGQGVHLFRHFADPARQKRKVTPESFAKETAPLISEKIHMLSQKLGLDCYSILCSIDQEGMVFIHEIRADILPFERAIAEDATEHLEVEEALLKAFTAHLLGK